MDNSDDRVYSLEVIEFTKVANEFCNQLEKAGEYSGAQLLKILQMIIPLLYLKTVSLPSFEPLLEEGAGKSVTEEDWTKIHDTVLSKLGEANDFPETIDERASDSDEKFYGSIAENIADIYQELKDYVTIYHIGTADLMNDAIWECTEHFRIHWGQKLVNTLRAVHLALLNPEKIGNRVSSEDEERAKRDTSDWLITRKMDDFRKGEDE